MHTEVKMTIRKNDQIQVMKGRERGKIGKILSVSAKEGTVLVEKLNLITKHMKPTQKNPQGGIVEKEAPIRRANILLFCGKCSKGVRHKIAFEKSKKFRACKKCGSSLEASA